MHRHTLQLQPVEDVYMYFFEKENKKKLPEKTNTAAAATALPRRPFSGPRRQTMGGPDAYVFACRLHCSNHHHSLIHPNCSVAPCWLYVHAKPIFLIKMMKGYFLPWFQFSKNKFKK
jgi:hypothetical protein